MPIDLTPKLTHVGQWKRTTNQPSGAPSAFGAFTDTTTITTLACYAYKEELARHQTQSFLTKHHEWKVILPVLQTDVKENEYFTNIIDHRGAVVYAGGRITAVLIYRHYRDGPAYVELTLDPN
jgi:hypothetical protein